MPLILAIDQGTTTTKCLLVDAESGQIVGQGSAPVAISYPQPGWVEQDGNDIWASVEHAATACFSDAGVGPNEVSALAISNQRESVLAWSLTTGEPLTPVLGWQDSRSASWCDSLGNNAEFVQARTGLPLDPMFSAPKMHWLLTNGGLAFAKDFRIGTIDSFLINRLTGADLIEIGNASRTLLLNIESLDWDDDLLALFGIPRSVLPKVTPSTGPFGVVRGGALGLGEVPVFAVLADSHAALYHHGRGAAGVAKATYGTGSSVMIPTRHRMADPNGVTATVAWAIDAQHPQYAAEGNILTSGAGLDWLARLLGKDAASPGGKWLSELAAQAPDSDGVVFVPAFTGLGAPYWDRSAQGTITGITGGTTAAHLARAALDGVANQVADVVDSVRNTESTAKIVADGGATASELLMQTQANLLGLPVEVAGVPYASALGAVDLAVQVLTGTPPRKIAPRGVFEPQLSTQAREAARAHWHAAVDRARGFEIAS